MPSFIDKIQLIRWMCSEEYKRTVETVLHPGFKKDLAGVCKIARKRFPFLNQGYFGNYQELKKDSARLWGVDVKEVLLPDDLLGTYVPRGKNGRSVILINKKKTPLFNLATLAHELSHVPAYMYYHRKNKHKCRDIHVRSRVALFSDALKDKEEILADVLTTLGAYPLPDFKKVFGNVQFGFRAFLKSLGHLPKHYPELVPGVLKGRDLLLNTALLIHFLRLRFMLNQNFGL